MKLQIYVLLCLLCLLFKTEALFYKSNVTDLTKCKVHYSRSGSVYKDFYTITENHETSDNGSYLLDFHFSVLASSDAHILLAPSEKFEKNDPVYEIVIGAGGNTFCDIRRMQKSNVKASVRIKDLLSALDPRSFWIHITKEGEVAVGREGEELAFISWIDPDPLPLNVFSFSTWPGIEAKWYFDCDRRNSIEEIEKKLTDLDKLRRDLLNQYDPYVRPVKNISTITKVYMTLETNYLRLDERRSTMEIIGTAKMAWHDEKLRWDPDEYNGIENIHVFRREIWHPDLMVFNAVGDGRDIAKDSLMVSDSLGNVEWNPMIDLNVWCDAKNLGVWPKDTHKCNVLLGFMKESRYIYLEFNEGNSSLLYPDSSEWIVLEVDIITNSMDNKTYSHPSIEMVVTMKRSSCLYNSIFFTPFLVIAVSLLSTFWVTPFGHIKISLVCSQIILSTVLLLGLAIFIPSYSRYTPYLVSLYSYSLVASMMAAIISILVINLSRINHKKAPPHIICSILTSRIMSRCFCLPNLQMSDEYGTLNEPSKEKHQLMWILLGITIDRIAFLIFLPLIIYAIYLNLI